MSRDKQYMGDGVYASHDGFCVILTTENGYGAQNTIVMEPETMAAVIAYNNRLEEAKKTAREFLNPPA